MKDKLFVAFGLCFLVAYMVWVGATEPIYRLFGGGKGVDFVHNTNLKPRP